MAPKLIDLYSGIGGLGLSAARSGFDLSLSVDNDPVLSKIHEVNFPRCPHSLLDVSSLTGATLLTTAKINGGGLAGLIGGSPCQGFSRAGKREKSDSRNLLFVHFFRMVSEAYPQFFLAENVQGILDSQNEEVVSTALSLVPKEYEVLDAFELNAADFGAATSRKRVFFFGYLRDIGKTVTLDDFYAAKWKSKTTVESALSGLPHKLKDTWTTDKNGWRTLRKKKTGKFWSKIYSDIPTDVGDPDTIKRFVKDWSVSGCIATKHSKTVVERFEAVPEGGTDSVSRMPRLKRNGLCPTLRAGTGKDKGSYQALRPIHFSENRVITLREAARLQGFPDWFRFHKTKWHSFRGIGNSVSPFVAEAVLSVIVQKLELS